MLKHWQNALIAAISILELFSSAPAAAQHCPLHFCQYRLTINSVSAGQLITGLPRTAVEFQNVELNVTASGSAIPIKAFLCVPDDAGNCGKPIQSYTLINALGKQPVQQSMDVLAPAAAESATLRLFLCKFLSESNTTCAHPLAIAQSPPFEVAATFEVRMDSISIAQIRSPHFDTVFGEAVAVAAPADQPCSKVRTCVAGMFANNAPNGTTISDKALSGSSLFLGSFQRVPGVGQNFVFSFGILNFGSEDYNAVEKARLDQQITSSLVTAVAQRTDPTGFLEQSPWKGCDGVGVAGLGTVAPADTAAAMTSNAGTVLNLPPQQPLAQPESGCHRPAYSVQWRLVRTSHP